MLSPLRARLGAARTRLTVTAMDRALHAFARVRYAMPDARPSRFGIRIERDVTYGPGEAPYNRLDVYMPERAAGSSAGGASMPTVMYVHGGGFAMLSKDTHRVMAMAIARAGYVVFNINYRLGPRHRFPAPLEDACRALAWVHDHAAQYGGDPRCLGLAGESAGGNLVTALAVAGSWRRPEPFARRLFDADIPIRAVVATYGFLDLGHTEQYLAHPRMRPWTKAMLLDAARSYVGPDVLRASAANPLASPLRIIEAGGPARPVPPFFASVGTRDPLLRCSKRLKAALDVLGTECELHVSPGEIHGYDAMVWRPQARAKWAAAHVFLGRHMAAADPRDARAAV